MAILKRAKPNRLVSMWTLFREVSLRHVAHAPLRTALVVFGIALGVSMLCSVLATNRSLVSAFDEMIERVAGKADLTVAGGEAGIPISLVSEIAELEGVEHTAAMLEVITRTTDEFPTPLMVLGVDFLGDTFFLPFESKNGDRVLEDPLAFVNDPTAVLLSQRLAHDRNLKVGDTLELVTPRGAATFHVRGLLEDKGPVASFGGQVAVMFIDAAQISFSRGESVDRVDLSVLEGHKTDDVHARIEARLAGRATVEGAQARTRRLQSAFTTFRNGLNVSGVFSLWVGMFLIYNAVSVSVAQRRKEVGTLRALGLTRSRVVLLFCFEALLMAVLGAVLGISFAQVLADFAMSNVAGSVNRFIVAIHPPRPELSPSILAIGVVAGLATTLLAAYAPARRASRIDPAEALRSTRSTAVARAIPAVKLALIGTAVTLLALLPASFGGEGNGYAALFVLMCGSPLFVPVAVRGLRRALLPTVQRALGVPGRLALDNVERALERSALTVVGLMLAVSMSVGVATFLQSFETSLLEWVDQSMAADGMILSNSPILDRNHLALDASALEKLEGLSGVTSINPVRSVHMDVAHRRMVVHAIDTRARIEAGERTGRAHKILEGPEHITQDALLAAPRILVSENASLHMGWHPGDMVTLATSTGLQKFEVYAVIVDYSSEQGYIEIDRKWFHEFWHDALIDGIEFSFAPEADRDQVLAEIRTRLRGTHNLFISLTSQIREELRSAAQSVLAYAKAPELIALVVALMGVFGTMLAAVIDRIRDVGLLRAIGATRGQVLLSLMAEAGFLGLAAALVGVVVGIPFGLVLLKVVGAASTGWSLPYAFPYVTALRLSLLIIATAAVGALLPGRRASRLDIKEALGYE